MEGTGDDSVDPRDWSSEKVATFVRALGGTQCFQSAGDQVLHLGVDVSVKKDIHGVVLLLSKDDRPLSETQAKTWFDNYKTSLNRKKKSEKDTDPKDKDQE